MQFLALLRRRTELYTAEQFKNLLHPEAERVRELYGDGFVRTAWSRGDVVGGCLVVESDSAEQAEETLGTLPLVRAGMADVQLIPLKPYRGFAPTSS